ncbi:MAG: cupin domain-containing protein [Methanobacteriota archaeon]
MSRIEVVRHADLRAGDATQGITRDRAFDLRGIAVSQTRVPGAVASGWHHHDARRPFGYIVVGRLRLEYGPGGSRAADLGLGDFFHIPPRLVHRDVNPSPGEDAVVVNVLAGGGATVVNVDGPDRA